MSETPAPTGDPGPAVPLRRDPVLRGLLALGLVVVAWFAADIGGLAAQVVLFWAVQIGLDLGFVLFSCRIARLALVPRETRRFWWFMTGGGLFFLCGDSLQTLLTISEPDPSSADGGVVQMMLVGTGVACCVIGMLTHPARITARERLRFALDAGTTMIGATIFIWYFSVSGQPVGAGSHVAAVVLSSALMLVATFALVKLLLGGNPPFTRKAGVLGGLSTMLLGLVTGLSPLLADLAYPNLGLAVRLLPCILLVATPRVQELQVRADPGVLSRTRRRPYSLLPYGAVGAAQALLLAALATGELTVRSWGVVAGVVLITVLVVVRQLVAFSDNTRLLGRLDRTLLTVRRQEERFRSLVQHASDITAVVRADGTVAYASPATERILGFPAEEVVGRRLGAVVHPDDRDTLREVFQALHSAPDEGLPCELRLRHRDGSWRWLGVIATDRLGDPSVGGIVCNARDVTESLESRDRLRHEATHDPLTGLANRALFHERIRTASLGAPGEAAILLIDLDDFKLVNDTLGHHAGDVLLVGVAQRLRASARTMDTVARLGGDEFALFLPGATAESGTQVAQRILESFAAPVHSDGAELTIKASIGVAAGPLADAQALQRAADAAMYEAKHGGKGRIASTTLESPRP